MPYFRVWTLVTSGFLELYFIQAFLNILTFILIGKRFEPFWGHKEFLKFILVVTIFSSILSFFTIFVLFVLIGDEWLWFNVQLFGFSGVIAAFSVAVKQTTPEQEIPLLITNLRARVSHFFFFWTRTYNRIPMENLVFTTGSLDFKLCFVSDWSTF